MSNEQDVKCLQMQTHVLKVHMDCEGCKRKVKKLLQKTQGVYSTTVDAEQGRVVVSGTVDASTLIRRLEKKGKRAEELLLLPPSKPKGPPAANNQKQHVINIPPTSTVVDKDAAHKQLQFNDMLQKLKLDSENTVEKQQLPALVKGFNLKDFKLPFSKEKKTVKFADAEEEDEFDDVDGDSEFEDEFDDSDSFDELEEEEEEELKQSKMKPLAMPPKKGGKVKEIVVVASKAAKSAGKKGSGDNKAAGVAAPTPNNDGKGSSKKKGGDDEGSPIYPVMQGSGRGQEAVDPNNNNNNNNNNKQQQQQYLAALLQKQRMMMMMGPYPPAEVPPAPAGYGYLQPTPGRLHTAPDADLTHYFSDENTNSCSVM